MKKLFYLLVTIIIIIFSDKSYSQTNQNKINFNTSTLENIELQTFNNLPLFGDLNNYGYDTLDKSNYSEYQKNLEIARIKIHNNISNYLKYYSLLELKFLYKAFSYLKKDKLYEVMGPTRELQLAYVAQQQTYKIALLLNNSAGYKKYFYNTVKTINNRGGYSRFWGGNGANENKKVIAYKKFIDLDLPKINKVSESLWHEDTNFAYIITKTYITSKSYNKDKQGFWINYSSNLITNTLNKGVHSSNYKTKKNIKDSLLYHNRNIYTHNLNFSYLEEKEFERKILKKAVFLNFPEDKVNSWSLNTKMAISII